MPTSARPKLPQLKQVPPLQLAILLFSFVLGLVFTFLVPPFQKPDEVVHFYKTIAVSQGHLLCSKNSSGEFVNETPKYLVDFPAQMLTERIAHQPTVPFPTSLYAQTLTAPYDTQTTINEQGSCFLPFFLYLPGGLALALPVALKANPLLIFYLGRFVTFLLSFALFYYAYRLFPPKLKLLPLLVLALPMTLFQVSSYSKDALHLSSGMVALAHLFLFLDQPKAVTPRALLTFFASLGVSIIGRPQYALTAVLSLLLAKPQLKKASRAVQAMSVFFVVGLIALIGMLLNIESYSAKALSFVDADATTFFYPSVQLQYLSEEPTRFLAVVLTTLEQQSDTLLKGMIGILGWLDYQVPWFVYVAFLLFGAYVFWQTKDHYPRLSGMQFLILTSVIVGTLLLLAGAMYLYATPVAAETIVGLQGRYYLLLVPLLFWWLAHVRLLVRTHHYVLMGIIVFAAIVSATLQRYYSNGNYYYPAEKDAFSAAGASVGTPVAVENMLTRTLELEPDKQLVGFQFYVGKNDVELTKPHVVRVFNESCIQELTHVVIDATTFKPNTQREVRFAPISSAEYQRVCVKVSPYVVQMKHGESLLLQPSTGGEVLVPLYLF